LAGGRAPPLVALVAPLVALKNPYSIRLFTIYATRTTKNNTKGGGEVVVNIRLYIITTTKGQE
jgi:hypothetical protein